MSMFLEGKITVYLIKVFDLPVNVINILPKNKCLLIKKRDKVIWSNFP